MKRLTVQQHAEWRIRLALSQSSAKPINEDHDEPIQVDPYAGDPPFKRSEGEVSRVLTILNSLNSLEERGNIR